VYCVCYKFVQKKAETRIFHFRFCTFLTFIRKTVKRIKSKHYISAKSMLKLKTYITKENKVLSFMPRASNSKLSLVLFLYISYIILLFFSSFLLHLKKKFQPNYFDNISFFTHEFKVHILTFKRIKVILSVIRFISGQISAKKIAFGHHKT